MGTHASAEPGYDARLDSDKARVWMTVALESFGLAGDTRRIEIGRVKKRRQIPATVATNATAL
jgi:hypothetical protein